MTPVFLRRSVIKTQRAAALCDWAELLLAFSQKNLLSF
jgi:hypothetical protein